MPTRTKVLIWLCSGCCVLAFVWVATFHSAEPRYKGAPLSRWVELLGTPTVLPGTSSSFTSELQTASLAADEQCKSARDAVRHVGTNAIPYLLEWITYEKPRWKSTLSACARKIPHSHTRQAACSLLNRASFRASGTPNALYLLNAYLPQIVPPLERIAADTNALAASQRARTCLILLAQGAVFRRDTASYPLVLPILRQEAAATNSPFSKFAADALERVPTDVVPLRAN